MVEPVLWKREPHTAAKHRVLRSYVDAWIPVMAQQALDVRRRGIAIGEPRLLIVDGFAGPGRYAGGEDGSPIILLKALLEHTARPRLGEVRFVFLFIEYDKRRVDHLKSEVAALGTLPTNVEIHIEHGEFEEVFTQVLDTINPGNVLIPTFGFIDPFGYSHSPMTLTGRLLDFPRCEALIFIPLTDVLRFVGREGQDNAMWALFGSERWRGAIPLRGEERREFLLNLFLEALSEHSGVRYARAFQLRTQDGRDYRLVFATDHRKGLTIIKDAMWAVDPVAGTSYVATRENGQSVLFTDEATSTVDTAPLLEDLRAHFGTETFMIEEAEDYALFHTPFRHNGHLKKLTLAPAERDGQLVPVAPAPRRRRCTYAAGTKLQFTA
jgi:three-Cys-motif partner protein